MLTVKVPSQQFVTSALIAGERANAVGSFLLLARRLDDNRTEELRRSWSDLDDLTHNDLLFITLGITPESTPSVALESRQHAVLSPEVGGVGFHRSDLFPKEFDRLWKYAEHYPDVAVKTDNDDRLIRGEGVTDVRRALGIEESQIPAFVAINYRAKTAYLIQLGADVSPVRLIAAVSEKLQDEPWRVRELEKEQKLSLIHI